MYDPFGLFGADNLTQPLLSGLGAAARRSPIQPYKDPAEESGVLSDLLGKTLGGIGYVGSVLDKPGRAVRGLLGGQPGELGNLIPFSDTLGLTDEKNRVSGEDLAKQWGLLSGEGQKGTFELRDLLGPALEIGLDPTTYATFGGSALTKAGNIARKVGIDVGKLGGAGRAASTLGGVLTPELMAGAERAAASEGVKLADVLGQNLGGHMGVGLPFATPAATFDLSGPLGLAGKAANLGLSFVPGHEYLKAGAQGLGRGLSALLDASTRGTTSVLGQDVARQAAGLEQKMLPQELEWLHGVARQAKAEGIPDLRSAIESGQTSPLLDEIRARLKGYREAQTSQGLKVGDWGEGYFPRQATDYQGLLESEGGGRSSRNPLNVGTRSQAGREFTAPTTALNEFFQDPMLLGNREERLLSPVTGYGNDWERNYVAKKLGMTDEDIAKHAELAGIIESQKSAPGLNPIPDFVLEEFAPLDAKIKEAAKYADYASSLDPQRAARQLAFFGNEPTVDLQNYLKGHVRALTNAEPVRAALGRASGEIGPRMVPIEEALGKVFDNPNVAKARLAESMPDLGTHVPQDIVNELTRSITGFRTPDAIQPILGAIDKVTNLTKPWLTTPFPGYQMRNRVTGILKNLESGIGPGQLIANEGLAGRILSGETIPGIATKFPHLGGTDEEVTHKIADLANIHAGAGGMTQTTDTLLPRSTQSIMAGVPGETPWPGLGETLKGGIPKSLAEANPVAVRGVGAESDINSIIGAGRKVEQHYDTKARLAGFMSLLEQGYSPEAAGNLMQAAHVNYQGMSDFEKNVMRRLVPFYSFARGSIPFEVKQLLEKPGQIQGQLAKQAYRERQDQGGFLPPYLGSGLAIPVGTEDNGQQRYLTGLGTPIEQALDFLHMGPKGGQNTVMSLLSQLNPLAKAPLEWATGKQFFSGRDLEDLQGLTDVPFLDQIIYNSPASRLQTTYRTLTDPRKGLGGALLNLGTGARITDVDMAKQRDIQARQLIEDYLRGQQGIRHFETLSVKPEDVGNLSPIEMALLRENKTVEARMKEKAKEAAKAAR